MVLFHILVRVTYLAISVFVSAFLFLKGDSTMDKIKTEEIRRERGRPKLDARITEEYAPSKRQALSKMICTKASTYYR